VFPYDCAMLADRIVAARNEGRLASPLVVFGYSTGADHALKVARRLGRQGVTVDKLVLLDPTVARSVPDNVRSCFNLYMGQPSGSTLPWFRGIAVSAESEGTELVNYNCSDVEDGRYTTANHFTLSADPDVQDLLIEEIVSVTDP